MKKFLLLATAALLVTGVTFADNGKKWEWNWYMYFSKFENK